MPESAVGDMHSAFSVVFVWLIEGLLADERAVDTRLKIPLESKQPGAMSGQMLIYSGHLGTLYEKSLLPLALGVALALIVSVVIQRMRKTL